MNFNSKKQLEYFLSGLIYIGSGSQGECYLKESNNTVFKIFHDYDEAKTEEEIMQFSNIKNGSFIWASSVITVNEKIMGYTVPYVKGKSLYRTDPLKVNLNKLERCITNCKKDINTISNKGVLTFDVSYNTLLGGKLYVIDHDEYTYRIDEDPKILTMKNNYNLDFEIYNFLVDTYFDNVVNDNKELKQLYKYKKEDVLEFLKLLRHRLSELSDKDITYLSEAKSFMDIEKKEPYYQRLI